MLKGELLGEDEQDPFLVLFLILSLRLWKATSMNPSPQNGMVVAPSLNHRATGIYHCKDGYQLNGTARTDCNYGNWTGVTPRCQEMYCPFPGFLENGKVVINYDYNQLNSPLMTL